MKGVSIPSQAFGTAEDFLPHATHSVPTSDLSNPDI